MGYCSVCNEKVIGNLPAMKARFEVSIPDSDSLDAVQWVCKYHLGIWLDGLDKGDVIQVVGMKEL